MADNERPAAAVAESNAVPPTPEGMRWVGFCRRCRDFTELNTAFMCLSGAHPKSDLAVALLLDKDEPLPHLPKVNLGAMFMPAIWGPAHGQWYMILFYPIWLLLDYIVYYSVHDHIVPIPLAVLACGVAAAFTIYYAMRANSVGYMRVAAEKSPEEYVRGERRWTWLYVLMGTAFIVLATYYNINVRPFA